MADFKKMFREDSGSVKELGELFGEAIKVFFEDLDAEMKKDSQDKPEGKKATYSELEDMIQQLNRKVYDLTREADELREVNTYLREELEKDERVIHEFADLVRKICPDVVAGIEGEEDGSEECPCCGCQCGCDTPDTLESNEGDTQKKTEDTKKESTEKKNPVVHVRLVMRRRED